MDQNEYSPEKYRSCLLGGAIGDALGAPVEFFSYDEIVEKYGEGGVDRLLLNEKEKAEFTDDTQMTLFTAEGLLRGECRMLLRGIGRYDLIVHHAYLRWLHTQGIDIPQFNAEHDRGYMIKIPGLYKRKSPGDACISALRSGVMGTMKEPINNSKGCGGVMRMAPAGLLKPVSNPFETGCKLAAITHGHPSGYYPAGCLAQIIRFLLQGNSMKDAIVQTMNDLKKWPGHEETYAAMEKSIGLVGNGMDHRENIENIGGGWIGEEALAIALYCSLSSGGDFKKGVTMAVNHGGDSDSTGAITGNLLGTMVGTGGIPKEWMDVIEMKDIIIRLADDLHTGFKETNEWFQAYPGS